MSTLSNTLAALSLPPLAVDVTETLGRGPHPPGPSGLISFMEVGYSYGDVNISVGEYRYGWGNNVVSFDPSTERNCTVYAGAGNDSVSSGQGSDHLYGNSGNDHLFAGAGYDFLDGGSGNDVIDGGRGADQMTGGAGQDVFVVDFGSSPLRPTADTIEDFQTKADTIDLKVAGTTANYRETALTEGHGLNAAWSSAQNLFEAGVKYVFVTDGTDGYLFTDAQNGWHAQPNAHVDLSGLGSLSEFNWSDIA